MKNIVNVTLLKKKEQYKKKKKKITTFFTIGFFFFFLREFQHMASAPDNSSLSSDQDSNQFLVQAGIKPQISYSLIS